MRSLLPLCLLAAAAPVAAQTSAVAVSGSGTSIGVTVPFGEVTRINGMTLRPVAIIEDSRCPPNANCVWAGRLIVEFETRGRRKMRLQLGQPIPFRNGQLTLASANGPAPAETAMRPQDYRFQIWFYGR